METQENVLDKCVLLSLSIHRLGVTKKVKSSEVQSDASPEMIRVSKKIIDSAEYDAISKRDGEFTRLLTSLALPSMFRAGVYAVPLALLDRIDSELEKYTEAREGLIEKFLEAYQAAVREAETLLGSLYDADNYPSISAVRKSFSIDHKYVSTSVPEKLREIRADIYSREQDRAKQEIESMVENVKAVLREAVRDLLAHAAEKLAPTANGKQQIFRDSLVGNIREFLGTFQARNIADDSDLAAICDQIECLLMGITPEDLRNDLSLRDEVRQGFDGLTATLDTMLVDRPARKMRRVTENTEVTNV